VGHFKLVSGADFFCCCYYDKSLATVVTTTEAYYYYSLLQPTGATTGYKPHYKSTNLGPFEPL
jgi:hypothetical protein